MLLQKFGTFMLQTFPMDFTQALDRNRPNLRTNSGIKDFPEFSERYGNLVIPGKSCPCININAVILIILVSYHHIIPLKLKY